MMIVAIHIILVEYKYITKLNPHSMFQVLVNVTINTTICGKLEGAATAETLITRQPAPCQKLETHDTCRVSLAQLVRFIVVELTHPGSNLRFDIGVAFTANYYFSWRSRPRRQ
jgi:hypothetical protein